MTRTPPAPVAGRRLLLVAIAAAIAGTLLVLSFAYADHDPRPHDVSVAVVGPPAAAARLRAGLDHALPGGFTVVREPSATAARTALRAQRIRGALVLGSGSGHPTATVLTAGAAGLTLQQAVSGALTGAAHAAGATHVAADDVAPLPSGDHAGLASFVLELGLLVPSVLGSAALYLVGLRSRLWWRVAAAALFAVLLGGLGTLVLTVGFGALTGGGVAVFGIAVLGALAFVLSVGAAQATFGLPATGLMALVLIFVGNAVSGGSVPTGMLPDGYRQISPWLPNGAIVHALRAVAYFGGRGLGQPLLALGIWAGGALLLLLVNDLLHSQAIRHAPERIIEIYATPGIVHARRLSRASTKTGGEAGARV
jgi:hypothetical protein